MVTKKQIMNWASIGFGSDKNEPKMFEEKLDELLHQLETEVRDRTQDEIFRTLKQDKEINSVLPHPIDAIEFVMEQRELNQNDMIPYFGSKSRVSEVLNKVRPLSKSMIRRLMAGLEILAEVLIQEYELSQPKEDNHENMDD